MGSASRILKNTAFLFVGRMFSLVASLGVYALVGRLLGAEGLGQFSFILTYAGMFIFLSTLGIHLYITREIARQRDLVLSYLGTALTLVLLSIPVTLCVLLAIVRVFLTVDAAVRTGIAIAGLYLALGTLYLLFSAAFQAFERMELDTASLLVENIATILLCAAILLAGGGVIGLIAAYAFARSLALGTALFLFTRHIKPLPRPSLHLSFARDMLRGSLPFAVNILTTTVYVQIDLLLLNLWKGNTASGYYKAATALIIPLSIVATSLNRALFPDMARSFISSLSRLTKAVESSIRYLFMMGWPMALGIALLAPQIIKLIYGTEFDPSVVCLLILAFIVPLRYVNNTMGATLTATDRQGWRATIILLSATLNLVLNLKMIPAWSYVGASVSTLITELFIVLALYLGVRRQLPTIQPLSLVWRSLLAGLLMAGVVFLLRDTNLVLVVFVGATVYLVALLGLKAFPAEDLRQIKQALASLFRNSRWLWSKP